MDKVWICESVGKLKGVGQLAKAKTNKLSIHTISDLQLHVHRHGIPKVLIRGFDIFYDIALQYLPENPPSSLKEHRKAKNTYISRYGDRYVDKLKYYTAMLKFCCITDLIC